MPAQMKPTAWGQGVKNAFIWALGVLAFWCVVVSAISLIFGQPLFDSGGVAVWVLWGLVWLAVLGARLYDRAVAGRLLVDCGSHPTWSPFLAFALIFFALWLTGGPAATSASKRFAILGPGVWVSVAGFWLIMAIGRLQVRENGIWLSWVLLPWGEIGSYHWANDSTLVVRPKHPLPLFQGVLPLPVSPEQGQAVEELLAKHCPARPTGALGRRGGRLSTAAQMTPTAWGHVEKNAVIWAIGFLALLGVMAAALPVISRTFPFFPFGDALWWVLYSLAFLGFPGIWLYGRAAAGRILFDCGRHPMWILFLVNAVLFLIMGLEDGLAAASVSKRSAIPGPGLWVWVGASYLVMATGRLQVRANGIWRYSNLLRWGKIGSYDWANDSTLVVRLKRPDPWSPGVLTVPPEHRQVVAELLARHCSAQPTD